ncbi:hypothetical protein KUDE01_029960, partial [Dissostichus eleginoides]
SKRDPGEPDLVRPAKHTCSDLSAAILPALLGANLRLWIAANTKAAPHRLAGSGHSSPAPYVWFLRLERKPAATTNTTTPPSQQCRARLYRCVTLQRSSYVSGLTPGPLQLCLPNTLVFSNNQDTFTVDLDDFEYTKHNNNKTIRSFWSTEPRPPRTA